MTPTIRCSTTPPPSSLGGEVLALYVRLSDGVARSAALVTERPDDAYALLWVGASIVRR